MFNSPADKETVQIKYTIFSLPLHDKQKTHILIQVPVFKMKFWNLWEFWNKILHILQGISLNSRSANQLHLFIYFILLAFLQKKKIEAKLIFCWTKVNNYLYLYESYKYIKLYLLQSVNIFREVKVRVMRIAIKLGQTVFEGKIDNTFLWCLMSSYLAAFLKCSPDVPGWYTLNAK